MVEPLYDYDPAAALGTPEAIAVFVNDALETGNPAYIAKALSVVARAKGMTDLARETGLPPEQVSRYFSQAGDPALGTTLAIMRALGIDVAAVPRAGSPG